MGANDYNPVVVIAEDDDDDYLLTLKALEESGYGGPVQRVKDGNELLAFLRNPGNDSPARRAHAVGILLLDLNMPGKDGREALKEIKSSAELRQIPVVVLTTSGAEADIAMAYDAGANSFIRKPANFTDFVETISSLRKYWLEIAELPRWRAGVQIHG